MELQRREMSRAQTGGWGKVRYGVCHYLVSGVMHIYLHSTPLLMFYFINRPPQYAEKIRNELPLSIKNVQRRACLLWLWFQFSVDKADCFFLCLCNISIGQWDMHKRFTENMRGSDICKNPIIPPQTSAYTYWTNDHIINDMNTNNGSLRISLWWDFTWGLTNQQMINDSENSVITNREIMKKDWYLSVLSGLRNPKDSLKNYAKKKKGKLSRPKEDG